MRDDIPERDRAGLREFGLVTGSILAALFGAVLPWLFDAAYPTWPWVVGGILVVWALVAPDSLRPIYRAWMRFALILARFTTPILMGIVYFMLITPTALIGRLFRRDPMVKSFDAGAPSYRAESIKPPKDKMERPY